MAGGNGPPYRPPCGGWSGEDYYAGGCVNHFRESESARVAAIHVISGGSGYTYAHVSVAPPVPSMPEYGQRAAATAVVRDGAVTAIRVTIPGWGYSSPPTVTITGDGTGAAAVAVLDGPKLLLNTACSYPPLVCPPSGPAIEHDPDTCQAVHADGNCYVEQDVWVNMAACQKVGWKAIMMAKTWHGALGFMQDTQPNAAISHKYQTCSRLVMNHGMEKVWTNGAVVTDRQWAMSASQQVSVDQNSGRLAETHHSFDIGSESAGLLNNMPYFGQRGTNLLVFANLKAIAGRIIWDSGPDLGVIHGTPDEFRDWLLSMGFTAAAVHLADDELEVDAECVVLEGDDVNGQEFRDFLHVEIRLDNPITAQEIAVWFANGPSGWDMADDIQYPWRTDNQCHIVPYVLWDEYQSHRSPDVGMSSTPMPPGSDEPTGAMIGAPVPTKQLQSGQRWVPVKHWQFRDMYGARILPATGWVPIEDGLPGATTFWTQSNQLSRQVMGAGAGWFKWEASSHRFYHQVYAEIFAPVPSHNFARPCGPDRFRIDTRDQSYSAVYGPGVTYCDSVEDPDTYPPLYLFRDEQNRPTAPPICGRIFVRAIEPVDQQRSRLVLADAEPPHTLQTGDTIILEDVPGLSGSYVVEMDGSNPIIQAQAPEQYDGKGWIRSPGAAHWKWNDDGWKGDYVVKQMMVEIGDTTQVLLDHHVDKCVRHTPCCPTIIVATPLGLEKPWPECVAAVEGVPGAAPMYGKNIEALCALALRHPDPLWTPDPGDILCEGGSQIYVGDPPPLVEARYTMPEGAPPLPAGFHYGGPDDPWYNPPAPDACWHGPRWSP